jgi:hypothetical protein
MSNKHRTPPKKPNEKYFVGSNGDTPAQLYFDREVAFADGHTYVDSFDDKGERVESYLLLDTGYTVHF